MGFTQELRRQADGIYQAIFDHPFVRGIARGQLEKEQLIHYVKQDYEYLNAYMRIYGIAISKSRTREEIAMFNEQIAYILNREVQPHQIFCQAAGVNFEELQGYPLAPSAHHYIRHMLTVAHEGSLGEIYAVLLPCPWTYLEIGQKLLAEVQPTSDHPFYEWIDFYGRLSGDVTEKFIHALDRWADTAREEERQRMADHFLQSCQLEYLFWDMAYRQEDWPVAMPMISHSSK
ncbi:thiaminase II [Paenibacillus sp. DXFW5]|uniref:Aminopyrimidine aminohydrolase n=1 Tax=Paenibacillus rhizolycopersici TaxID=2780073 RepID=A0ABS2H6N0_9BACL|nr:thiaminase II [Paenibacillus rhizolycopersici]MBM6995490.1 thiaminase II [Paenibacillus rhizolycopersici]